VTHPRTLPEGEQDLGATERSLAVKNPRVEGRCPMGCGETLFLGDGGYVTCSWHRCPDPGAAHDLLQAQRLSSAWVTGGVLRDPD
jgi:hypothetical protein